MVDDDHFVRATAFVHDRRGRCSRYRRVLQVRGARPRRQHQRQCQRQGKRTIRRRRSRASAHRHVISSRYLSDGEFVSFSVRRDNPFDSDTAIRFNTYKYIYHGSERVSFSSLRSCRHGRRWYARAHTGPVRLLLLFFFQVGFVVSTTVGRRAGEWRLGLWESSVRVYVRAYVHCEVEWGVVVEWRR